MITIIQLIYVKEGKESVFHEFEDLAIPLIGKYNGRLTLRIRPDSSSVIESTIGCPYEIHIVDFDTVEDFDRYKGDPIRQNFLHLKEESVKTSIMIRGKKI